MSGAGAGLPVLASVATVVHLLVALIFPESNPAPATILHEDLGAPDPLRGRAGPAARLLEQATSLGFAIDQISTEPVASDRRQSAPAGNGSTPDWLEVTMHVHGTGSVNYLAAELSEVGDVEAVLVADANAVDE